VGTQVEDAVREVERRLRAVARPHRAGTVDGHSASSMEVLGDTVPDLRNVVRDLARALRDADPATVIDVARRLARRGILETRQVAYELLGRRADVRDGLGVRVIEALGRRNDNWKSVDTFGCEVTGPCWRDGRLTDAAVLRWARSANRWWRRTALVSTIPLNMKSRGGRGDPGRTLVVAETCAGDRDAMVAKALSWALRELAVRDAAAVRAFVRRHRESLAPRVVREVANVLETGRKS